MEIKISGYIFAAFERVKKVIAVNLQKDDFSIEHEDLFAIVTLNGETTYFECETLTVV